MDLQRYYQRVFADVAALKYYVYAAIALFLAGGALGMIFPEAAAGRMDAIREMAERLRGEPAISIILAIFFNNVTAAAIAVVFGAILGLFPAFAAVTNGTLLGVLLLQNPLGIIAIVPHGIFELPAVFIAWGLGIWVGMWVFESRLAALGHRLWRAGHIFLAVVLPLLVIGAVIEGVAAALLYHP